MPGAFVSNRGFAVAATEIANAYVALYTKMPGVEKDIKESLGGADDAFEGAGGRGGARFSGAAAAAIVAGAAVVAAAVVAVTTKAVMAFGELEQNVGGAEAVFGDYADTVKGKGVEAYKTLGLSQSDYLATANKMGALFQGSGIDQQRSLDLTTDAMQRAADMASVMGIEQSVAMESVAGAAKGNFTMMDNLGVAMNATNIEAYALAQGMEGWSYSTATAAEKAEVAMAMFMDSTSQYAGNFEKEATETVTGSIGLMGAAWDSLLEGLGDKDADMSQLSANLVEAFKAVVKNVAPVVGEIFASLPEVLGGLADELGPMLGGLFGDTDLGGVIGQFIELWSAISPLSLVFQALEPLLPMIMDLFAQLSAALIPLTEAVLPIFTSLFEALIPIIMMLVEAIVPLLEPIFSLIQPLLDLVMMILPPLMELLNMLVPIVSAIVGAIVTFLIPVFQGVVDMISGVLSPAIQMIQDVLMGINDFIVGVFTGDWELAWQGIVDIFSGIWNGLTSIVEGIVNGIIGIVNGAIDGINGIAGGVSDLTGGAIDFTIPHIPQLAAGGIVKAQPGGIPAVIGEGRYDEAVLPLSPSVLSALGGGGGHSGPLVEVNAAPGVDVAEIGRIAANEVDWQLRGA